MSIGIIHNSRLLRRFAGVFVTLAALVAVGCSRGSGSGSHETAPDTTIVIDADTLDGENLAYDVTDTLRAVTLYGPTSYFIYRGEKMGYDYTLLRDFARDSHLALTLTVAPTLGAAIDMLDDGRAELLAYEVPITAHYRQYVIPCGPESYSTQVLVQQKERGRAPVEDVTELVGHEVYVIGDSKYERRLANLNDELAGGIIVHTVDPDSATAEDLIAQVWEGKIPMTVVDSNIARLNSTYYHGLDISTPVSMAQRSSWAVAPGCQALADSIDRWFAEDAPKTANADLLKRYFEMSKAEPYKAFDFTKGYISNYDRIFKRYAPTIGWDWRLLAAQAYTESRFNARARSWAGARGLMQVMPSTGRGYGANINTLTNPETSVSVAVRLLRDLDRYLLDYVPNDKERLKFVIAAYNCGIAHIYDAMALAKKYGYNPQVWDDNVERALLMKMNPEFYNDPVVKYGYARGTETSAYVKRIMRFYDNAVREIPA